LQLFGEPAGDFLLSVHEAMLIAWPAQSAPEAPGHAGQPIVMQIFTTLVDGCERPGLRVFNAPLIAGSCPAEIIGSS
jgi:hypothetical protein